MDNNKENKTDNSKDATDFFKKELSKINFILKIAVYLFLFLRYVAVWLSVAFLVLWITLPVFFIWTLDWWYLKVFGTVPFISLACYFFMYGLSETFKYNKKKATKEKILIKDDKEQTESLVKAIKTQEEVIKNTTETTLKLLHLLKTCVTAYNLEHYKNGEQNNITDDKKD